LPRSAAASSFPPSKRPPIWANSAELVATLEHRNGWHRDTAARLLALADSLLTHGSASQQVQALPAALAALRAVLDLTDQDPLLRGDEIVTAIATALGVSDA